MPREGDSGSTQEKEGMGRKNQCRKQVELASQIPLLSTAAVASVSHSAARNPASNQDHGQHQVTWGPVEAS